MSNLPVADLIVYAAAIMFLVMGVVTLIRPRTVSDTFGVPTITPDMRNEIRAVYGGFGVFMCGLLLATFQYPETRNGVLLMVAVALLGMAAGRVIGFTIERPSGKWPYLYFVGEIILGALLLYARASSPTIFH